MPAQGLARRLRPKLVAVARRALAAGPVPGLKYAGLRVVWWLTFRCTRRKAAAPKVTLIVPVYNVERYLADALRSARAQNWPNLEIIVVNDGATDRSAAIIDDLNFRTRFMRVVVQPNAGLGAARNAGLRQIIDTDYVMFLDSDDLLPLGAVRRFVRQAQRSGSPLVVGKAVCFYGARYFDRPSTAAYFRRSRTAISVAELPQILGDATSWNKLYHWAFWRDNALTFPEGVAYEDMTLVVRAYLAAKQFDVLASPSYFWRVRAEGESLSQRRTELVSLRDRLSSIEQIDELLRAAVVERGLEPAVHLHWLARVLSLDLQLFAEALAVTDEAFFHELHSRASAVFASAPAAVWELAEGRHLAVVAAAIAGDRAAALAALSGAGSPGFAPPR